MSAGATRWRRNLRAFLLAHFTDWQLELFVDDWFDQVATDIRWNQRLSQAAADLVKVLDTTGRVPELWKALRDERPLLAGKVACLARQWEAAEHPRGLAADDLDPVVFADALPDPDSRRAIAEEIGLDGERYADLDPHLAWAALLKDATAEGWLDHLLLAALAGAPALAAALPQPPRTGPWYQWQRATESMFVGPRAQYAVFDRERLRAGLRELADDNSRVLVVAGDSGLGKSYSWRLIEHVVDNLAGDHDINVVEISTHRWARQVFATDIAQTLSRKLFERDFAGVPTSERPETQAQAIVDTLVGSLRNSPQVYWIVLDGFDRHGVEPCAREFAVRMVDAVERGELGRNRLVLTGLPEPIAGDAADGIFLEELRPLDGRHIRAFFEQTFGHLGLRVDDRIDRLTADTMGAGPDLRAMRRRAWELMQELAG